MEIPAIPSIPDELREAAAIGTLVPFVGAGASILAGSPDWSDLADQALRYCIDKGKFTYGRFEQLKSLPARVRLTVASSLAEENGLAIPYAAILPGIGRPNETGRQIYRAIGRLGKTIVTTNYDDWLDYDLETVVRITDGTEPPKLPKRTVFSLPAEHTAFNLTKPDTVFHLHGSVDTHGSMVLTTQDYLRHYANAGDWNEGGENPILSFLSDLFRDKNILFVGYSLSDLEILEYALLKSRFSSVKGETPRHYILQGFFSHQSELADAMEKYFNKCGIGLLPFRRDERDWGQLVEVIEQFAANLPAQSLAVLEELDQMERLLNG
jgi:hypothetical protein